MRKTIGEILDEVKAQKTSEDKIAVLKSNDHVFLRQFIKYCLDPSIEFLLPEEDPPFKQMGFRVGFSSSDIFSELKRMYLFVKPHPTEKFHAGLANDTKKNALKREQIFVGMLESFDVSEQQYFLTMKRKDMDFLTIDEVNQAFPNLIPTSSEPQENQTLTKKEPTKKAEAPTKTEKPKKDTPPKAAKVKNIPDGDYPYNNLGKCKTCKGNDTVMEVKGGKFKVTCQGCGAHTDGTDTSKNDVIQAWRALPPGQANGKASGKEKPAKAQPKAKEEPEEEKKIVAPPKKAVEEFKGHPNSESYLEDVAEDLSGIEPAETPWELDEETGQLVENTEEEKSRIILPGK